MKENTKTTKIKSLRKQTGLSQSKFATLAGIPVRTLQDWECGRHTPPDYVIALLERLLRSDTPV